MSNWNEETKKLESVGGRSIALVGADLAVDHPWHGSTYLGNLAPADLAAFGHACLEAAGEPVETTPAPFKENAAFEDVQVGDTVRIARRMGDAHDQVSTALVDGKTANQLFSANNKVLYVEGAKKDWGTIDILSRPEPPKPVLPTEMGARIVVEAVTEEGEYLLNTYGGSLPAVFEYDGAILWRSVEEGVSLLSERFASWHLAPEFPRTVEASEAHEHVGCRVTVEKGGNTYTGRLSFASEGTPDSWLLSVEVQDAPHRLESHSLWLPADHPITLEAPADAGASVVGGAV